MRRLLALTVALLACSQIGCATIVRGTKQEVRICCETAGARLTVDGSPVGTGTVALSRGDDHVIRAEANGYEPRVVMLRHRIGFGVAGTVDVVLAGAGATAGAVALGVLTAPLGELILMTGAAGFVGGAAVAGVPFLVDLATGAIFELDPAEVRIELLPVVPDPPPTLVLEAFCLQCSLRFEAEDRFCRSCSRARGKVPSK